ncbi:MAG: hypothetical protein GX446_05045 [Chthonomonadales bacterium]|nr:hypothetical protein [Chthonomonadales bacterium]
MQPTLHYVPHTHWEGAVFKTREEYLEIGLPNILRALRLLETDPDYRFTLDQSCYVEPFLRRHPEEAERFRQFVAEGRLAIVGGTHVMHDGNMPGPESYVRQIQYGRAFFRRALGVDPTVAWQLDTFGHHAQTPQLLRLAGYGSIWFFRGVPSWDTRSEFMWEALDGTRIPAYWLPHGYAVAYGSPQKLEEFAAFMQGRYAMLGDFTDQIERLGPAGADVCEPEEHVAPLVRQMNASGAPVRVVISVPEDYERAAPPSDDWPVIRGEMNPIFQGAYSSRIELKQLTREIEALLTDSEALGAVLTSLGITGHADPLWDAWEPMLFNQAHDLMSGVMTDHVYEDTLASYARSKSLATEALDRAVTDYVEMVDTGGAGIPLVVINTLPWERTDLVFADIGFDAPGAQGVAIIAADGNEAPAQLVEATRGADGRLLTARVAFVARNVPAMGHAVYRAIPHLDTGSAGADGASVACVQTAASGATVETDCLRMMFDASGALVGLRLLPGGQELIGGPANVIARETDQGDLWEPYRPLDGGSRIAMKERHPVAPDATLSSQSSANDVSVCAGPVYTEVRVEGALGEGQFASTVRVAEGIARVDIRTTVRNNERFVRYRALFPTTVRNGRRTDEIPFGAIERPDGIEYPAQNWMDWSGPDGGLAILNRGLPGANVTDDMLMLSLLRSTCIVAYGFGGGYEPGMSSDTGFELGQTRTFDYALLPHAGDWRDASLHRRGAELNHPLIVRASRRHEGRLPDRWSFMQHLDSPLSLTSMRPSPNGGVILRIYEATGQDRHNAELRFARPVSAAWETDLLDEHERPVDTQSGAARLSFRGFEVKTVRVLI